MFRHPVIYLSFCALLAHSCSKAVEPEVVNCNFTASLCGGYVNDTRAEGDGSNVDKCVMEIFYNGESCGQTVSDIDDDLKADFSVPVVVGRTYDVAFWAYKSGKYDVSSLKNVFCTSGNAPDDAFCCTQKSLVIPQTPTPIQLSLQRPLALVSVSPAPGSVTYSSPTSYNVLEDSFGTADEITTSSASFYIFTGIERTGTDITVDGKSLTNVPIQRNYKTNITIAN